MASMKVWEREIIEYRPNIGLDTNILSIVSKRSTNQPEQEWTLFTPTLVVQTATTMLGTDVIESLMASLSRVSTLLSNLDAKLTHDPTYEAYQKALKEGDPITARHLYLDHLIDINGPKEFDVYPMIADLKDEMEVYLNHLNQELFDGQADYSDLSIIRKAEEQQVAGLLDIESEDIRVMSSADLTENQTALIQRFIEKEETSETSIEDYLQQALEEKQRVGSPRINYDDLTSRVQVIASAGDKTNMFKEILDMTDSYLDTRLANMVYDDLAGSLEYLIDVEDSLPDMKDALQMTFDHHANRAKHSYINQLRLANREVREFLDREMSEVRQKKQRTADRLKKFYDTDKFQSDGGQAIMYTLRDGVDAANATWKYIMVEHMGTTDMNLDQGHRFFDHLQEKSKHQRFHQYVDLVDREFDRSNKDKEMNQFISTHNLHTW